MRALALLGGAVALFVAAGTLGVTQATSPTHPNALRLERGVPVVVADTPQDAVAAADNYLAAEDQALLKPAKLRLVVDTDWAPQERQVELSQGLPWMALPPRTTPSGAARGCGGACRITGAVAANKLESFARGSAQVAVWHEIVLWGPAFEPSQYWMLDTLALVWDGRAWVVSSRVPATGSQTPVPEWTNGTAVDQTGLAWDQRLAGMTPPLYGGGRP